MAIVARCFFLPCCLINIEFNGKEPCITLVQEMKLERKGQMKTEKRTDENKVKKPLAESCCKTKND